MNQAIASQSKPIPILTRNVKSLCEKLREDQGIDIEPEDLEECLKKKEIWSLTQEIFDMIVKDFIDSHSDEQLRQNFRFFDENNDGEISKKEWEKAVNKLTEKGLFPVCLSKNERKAMFKAADTDNNKKISFEEYKTMVREEPKPTPKSTLVTENVSVIVEEIDQVSRMKCVSNSKYNDIVENQVSKNGTTKY